MARWNLFFSLTVIVLAGLWPASARAINLHALYTASCQREVGIMLNVTPRQVFLLNLTGKIVPVDRFEIIYFATYPLDIVPMDKVLNPSAVPFTEIKTWQRGEMRQLVRGWPVDFSKDKISFLSLRGSELVIERSSIWSVESDPATSPVEFSSQSKVNYEFIHPYAFASCPVSGSGGGRLVKVPPQQLLSDPVAIKRELDRLMEGHEQVRAYESDQQFYAVPEVYTNETSLGLWISTDSRYGASGNRKNNFTPVLVNEFSSGPFGFQSRFLTGSAPMPFSIHEETQTQTYYRMKADYFHFSGMVDPSLLLVGNKYKWAPSELNAYDVRANDSAFMEFGFDYGYWSLELGLGGAANWGAQSGAQFNRGTVSLPRFGLRYQRATWMFHVFGGATSSEGFVANIFRANLEFNYGKDQRYLMSAFTRSLKFEGRSSEETGLVPMDVRSDALTAAVYAYYRFKSRYWFGVSGSVESSKVEVGGVSPQSKNHIYPKGAAYISLRF